MYKLIEAVAQKLHLPSWWIQAIAVEYTDCREFATRDEIWTFNFDRVSEEDLVRAVETQRVVVYETVIHNIHQAVFVNRTIQRLVSNVPVPVVSEPDDAIAEGPISDYCFVFGANSLETWDPKLSFSQYFQVRDEDGFWQWHIADFITVAGRNYGKWVSSEVDLQPLDQIHEKLAQLRNPVIKLGEPGHQDFKLRVEAFYRWLNEVRKPILRTLEDVHVAKRSARPNFLKVTKGVPPLLSRFESCTVRNKEIYSKFFAAPVFFRASREHALRAQQIVRSAKDDMELVSKLDELYMERATAIILGVACLEAFINAAGYEYFASLWSEIEQLSVVAKWRLFLTLKGKESFFKPSQQPYQFFIELKNSRNYLVHYKTEYEKVRPFRGKLATRAEYYGMREQLVHDLPIRLPELIRELCQAADIPVPTWLEPHPGLGWLA